MNPDLLTPSLSAKPKQGIYSTGALIITALLGGPLAVAILFTLNAHRLGRLKRDALWLLGAFGLSLGVLIGFVYYQDTLDRDYGRVLQRALGFALAGGVYLIHRREYRAMTALGIDPPNAWVAVPLAIVATVAVSVGFIAAVGVLGGLPQ